MNEQIPNPENRIALFQHKAIRRTIHDNEWWFVVEDVVLALIDSRDPKQYIQRMKQRDPELGKGWVQFVHTLAVPTDGGPQPMLCANTEGLFRIIQSIPSPKAEPFKRWLAKVGYERIQEIEDPELANKRIRALYKARDHMTDLELIFSMLGEAATTEITRTRDAQGFPQNRQAAHAGGTVAGNARRELEDKSGRKVVTSENYLALTQSVKKAKALAKPAPPRKPDHAEIRRRGCRRERGRGESGIRR